MSYVVHHVGRNRPYLEEALEVGIMVSEEEENDHDGDDVDVHIYEGTEATLKI